MPRPSALSTLSTADLHREIARRQRSARTLARKRAALARRLAALDTKIAAMGGGAGTSGSTRRFKNSKSLAESLRDVLKGKTMRVVDAAKAVQKAGFRSNAKSFGTMVGLALNTSGKFRRVGRGVYTAR